MNSNVGRLNSKQLDVEENNASSFQNENKFWGMNDSEIVLSPSQPDFHVPRELQGSDIDTILEQSSRFRNRALDTIPRISVASAGDKEDLGIVPDDDAQYNERP